MYRKWQHQQDQWSDQETEQNQREVSEAGLRLECPRQHRLRLCQESVFSFPPITNSDSYYVTPFGPIAKKDVSQHQVVPSCTAAHRTLSLFWQHKLWCTHRWMDPCLEVKSANNILCQFKTICQQEKQRMCVVWKRLNTATQSGFFCFFFILGMYFLQLELIDNPRSLKNLLSIHGRL